MRILVAAVLLGQLAVSTAWTQPDWARITGTRPALRSAVSYVYDPVKQRVLAFGTDDLVTAETWEWDGTTWTRLRPVTSPGARFGFRMVYDSARGRIVLFGGWGNGQMPFNDLWEWDGRNWIERRSTNAPPGRYDFAMAYDAARGTTVVFSGRSRYGTHTDHWEWNGTSWTQRAPTTMPGPRLEHGMAYDPVRRRVVMFGGRSAANKLLDQTWEWDGTNWTLATPTTAPPPRSRHAMTWDPVRRSVVVAGSSGVAGPSPAFNDLWLWNGTTWTQATPTATYPIAIVKDLVFDVSRARLALFLEQGFGFARFTSDDAWEWDGTTWRAVSAPDLTDRSGAALAYDGSRRTVWLFGGNARAGLLADTWAWDGSVWRPVTTPVAPTARWGHAIVYDPVRRRTLLFGGQGATGVVGDTWEWDGANWIQATPTASPPARIGHALAYDVTRRRVVLFGGADPGTQTLYGDTWEWDGTNWTRRATTGPQAREGAALAFDRNRSDVVMFGGNAGRACPGGGCLGDTWAWNGAQWTNITPTATGPAARRDAALAFHVARQRVILSGGFCRWGSTQNCFTTIYTDAWEWTGSAWVASQTRVQLPYYQSVASHAYYDDIRGRVAILQQPRLSLWEYAARDFVASSYTVSLATGGTVRLSIDVGLGSAQRGYVVTGCFDSGTARGIPLGSKTLLLNPDAYFWLTLTQPALVFRNGAGPLGKSGRASATVRIPPGLPATLAGQRLFHAAVAYGSTIEATTTPVPLTLVP